MRPLFQWRIGTRFCLGGCGRTGYPLDDSRGSDRQGLAEPREQWSGQFEFFRSRLDRRHGFARAELAEAAVDPLFRELLLHAVLRKARAQVAPVHLIERLILIEATEDDGFCAARGVLVHLQALSADLLH